MQQAKLAQPRSYSHAGLNGTRIAIPPLDAVVFTLAGMAALLLGSWIPDERLILAGVPLNTVFLAVISLFATFSKIKRRSLKALLVVQIPFLLLGVTAFWSGDPAYGVDKLVTLVITGNVAFLLFNHVIDRHGSECFGNLILGVLTLLLVATVIFKLAFGFFSREVPFLINGPIVFGRLMSIALVLAFFLLKGKPRLLMLAAFFLSIVWTESKGPILAAIVTLLLCALYVAKPTRRFAILSVLGALLALGSYIANKYIDPSDLGRLGVLVSLASGDLEVLESAKNEGSLGVRFSMWRDTLAAIPQHSLGLGLGGWSVGLPEFLPIRYPHNLLIELWAEGGVVIGSLALLPFVGFLFAPKSLYSFVALSLLLAQMVSGDLADARMLLIFALVAMISVPESDESALFQK